MKLKVLCVVRPCSGPHLVLVEEVVAARDVHAAVAPRVEEEAHPQVAVLLLPLLAHVHRPQRVAEAPLLPHEEREAVKVLGPEVSLEDDLRADPLQSIRIKDTRL